MLRIKEPVFKTKQVDCNLAFQFKYDSYQYSLFTPKFYTLVFESRCVPKYELSLKTKQQQKKKLNNLKSKIFAFFYFSIWKGDLNKTFENHQHKFQIFLNDFQYLDCYPPPFKINIVFTEKFRIFFSKK